MGNKSFFQKKIKSLFTFLFILGLLVVGAASCGRLWGGLYRYPSGGSGSIDILGLFAGAVGNTAASTGSCPAAGAASTWCTGGTFGLGTGDGQYRFPRKLIVDKINSAIYAADGANHRIVKIDLSSGAFIGAIGRTTASGGTCPAAGAAPSWCTGGFLR